MVRVSRSTGFLGAWVVIAVNVSHISTRFEGLGGQAILFSGFTRSETAHESSYLPFIYASGVAEGSSSSTSSENISKLKGRRTFNANGQEVAVEVSASIF